MLPEHKSLLRIAVLISGGGTTLKNFIDQIAGGKLTARIELVVSSNPAAGGLKFASEAGIPFVVVERKDYDSTMAFSQGIFAPCRAAGVDLVALGGCLKLLAIPADF